MGQMDDWINNDTGFYHDADGSVHFAWGGVEVKPEVFMKNVRDALLQVGELTKEAKHNEELAAHWKKESDFQEGLYRDAAAARDKHWTALQDANRQLDECVKVLQASVQYLHGYARQNSDEFVRRLADCAANLHTEIRNDKHSAQKRSCGAQIDGGKYAFFWPCKDHCGNRNDTSVCTKSPGHGGVCEDGHYVWDWKPKLKCEHKNWKSPYGLPGPRECTDCGRLV